MIVRNRVFGATPALLHVCGPGGTGVFARFREAARRCARREVEPCPDLTVLTWNNGAVTPDKPLGAFEESCRWRGVEPLVLGQGVTPWKNLFKLALTAEALERVRTPYVLGADSSDVLLLASPADTLTRFLRHFTCDLVFQAGGPVTWPPLPEFREFETSLPMAAVARGRHGLVSGCFLGRTEFCRRFFAEARLEEPVWPHPTSDQAVCKRLWPRFYPRAALDYLDVLFHYWGGWGWTEIERPPWPHHRVLLRLARGLRARLERPLAAAEVGVHEGRLADALLRELPDLHLTMIDPWAPYEGASTIGEMPAERHEEAYRLALFWTEHAAPRRQVLRCDSLTAAARRPDASLDLVFIDANHLYSSVRADLRAWAPKLRPGGLLCGHDYNVGRDRDGPWGVKRAVDEFAQEQGRQARVEEDGVWWLA